MSELPKPMTFEDILREWPTTRAVIAGPCAIVAREQWRRDMEAVRDWLRARPYTYSGNSDLPQWRHYETGPELAELIDAALKEEAT